MVSRGKMEHGGKMEHRVFWKKHARRRSIFPSTWFLSSASSASYIEIKLATDHVLSIARNVTLLINQFTHQLLMVKNNYVPLLRMFTSFDWATGDITVDKMRFLQSRGQNETWGLNKMVSPWQHIFIAIFVASTNEVMIILWRVISISSTLNCN